MFDKILIANRGEIACRVMRTCARMGIKTVAVYSDADAMAQHVLLADEAVHIGPASASESYLVGEKIIKAAKKTGAKAIHPGYGFLSENPEFSEACAAAGLTFIGPSAASMRAMALKGAAKQLMIDAGVPVVPGYHGAKQDDKTLQAEADKMGYPVLIKAIAGGGGKGMRPVANSKDFMSALKSARREAKNSFGNDKVLIEKLIEKPRHIELQVFGDSHGNAVHLFERDCSLQRRHQKVIEEAPAPGMDQAMRTIMGEAAVKAAKAIDYQGAGTIEFIVDVAKGLKNAPFYFMEMNTRLQVEHPVTEMITGTDLVEWQLRVAYGEELPATQADLSIKGHAIEVRLYAEDPLHDFLPAAGHIDVFTVPDMANSRVESGVVAGDTVSIHYDPMIAKLVVWDENRKTALKNMTELLQNTHLIGLPSNRSFLLNALQNKQFAKGDVDTGFIPRHIDTLIPSAILTAKDRALATLCLWQNDCNIAAEMAAQSKEPDSPWHVASGFALNTTPHISYVYKDENGNSLQQTLTFKDYAMEISEGTHTFQANIDGIGNHSLLITLDGVDYTVGVVVTDHAVMLATHEKDYQVTRLTADGVDQTSSASSGDLYAPMPGKVIEIMVKNGDMVTIGQPLIVMEAMKMEQTQCAPKDGCVTNLTLKTGDQVADSQLLLSITDS